MARSVRPGRVVTLIAAFAPAVGPLRGPTWHAQANATGASPRSPHLTAFLPSRRCGPSAPPGTSQRGRRNQTSKTPHRGRRVPTRRSSSFFRPISSSPTSNPTGKTHPANRTDHDHHRVRTSDKFTIALKAPVAAVRRRQRHAHPAVLLGSRHRHRPRQGDLRQVRAARSNAWRARSNERNPGVCGVAS